MALTRHKPPKVSPQNWCFSQEHREDSQDKLRLKLLLTKRKHWQGEEHAIMKQNPTTDSSLGQAGLDLSYETKKKVSTP